MSKVQLSPSFIKSQLEAGVDKETIRLENYPTLNVNQWKQALKAMNLSGVRAKKVTFEIIDETTVETVTGTTETTGVSNQSHTNDLVPSMEVTY